MNRNRVKTHATMSKKSELLSEELTIDFLFGSNVIIAVKVSFTTHYAGSIYFIFLLCMESNALEKSSNKCVTSRFFACTPSMSRFREDFSPKLTRLQIRYD